MRHREICTHTERPRVATGGTDPAFCHSEPAQRRERYCFGLGRECVHTGGNTHDDQTDRRGESDVTKQLFYRWYEASASGLDRG